LSAARWAFDSETNGSPEDAVICPLLALARHRYWSLEE